MKSDRRSLSQGFIGGLSTKSLVRVEFNGNRAREAQRFDMRRRIREVEQGPDGSHLAAGRRNARRQGLAVETHTSARR